MEFRKRTIRDVDVTGKIVLVRVDYNVPMKDGKVVEDMRIRASLPTINYLLDNGARKIVLISHLGRPDGEVKPEFSLEAAAGQLSALMPEKFVTFINATTGDKVKNAVNFLPDGGIIMLENLRFSPAEEENSEDFAREIVEA